MNRRVVQSSTASVVHAVTAASYHVDRGATGGAMPVLRSKPPMSEPTTDAPRHREEATWVLRLEASAEFDASYDGDLDGFAWRDDQFADLRARVLAAALRELKSTPGWTIRIGNQGRDATDEVVALVALDPDSEAFAPKAPSR